MPVGDVMAAQAHCYLWVPNALVAEGLRVLEAWGFTYKTMLVWHKVRKDGGSDGRGVGFYFRNVTEPVLFGVRGRLRTRRPGRRQVNLLATQKREHSRKPDELYPIIEACSPGPFLELFAALPAAGLDGLGQRGRRHDHTARPAVPGLRSARSSPEAPAGDREDEHRAAAGVAAREARPQLLHVRRGGRVELLDAELGRERLHLLGARDDHRAVDDAGVVQRAGTR